MLCEVYMFTAFGCDWRWYMQTKPKSVAQNTEYSYMQGFCGLPDH